MCSFALPASAADGTEPINASDMTVTGKYYDEDVGDWVDCSDVLDCRIYHNSSTLDGFYSIRTPLTLNDKFNYVLLTDSFSINSEHEYNISFDWGYTQVTSHAVLCVLGLYYYDSDGKLLKEQQIAIQEGLGNFVVHSIDIDFKPDVSDLDSGYKCRLYIGFQSIQSSSSASEVYCISPEINLIDKDDDSGWFQKILDAITSIPDKLRAFFENLGAKFDALKESIVNAFVELKDNLIEGLKSLFVPSDGFFEEKKAELETFLEDHFGILWTAPNIVISTIKQLLTIDIEEPSITMPAIQFTWEDKLITLTEPMTVNFNDYIGEGKPLEVLYNFYKTFLTIVFIFLFINYCLKKYHYIFGKDGEAVEH